MFQKGDYIIYGNTGVCCIDDICTPTDIPIASKNKLYYHLSPVHGSGTIYIPVDTSVFMRPVITRDQALRLISRIPQIPADSFKSPDQRMLAEHYKSVIHTHKCENLIQLIKTAYLKNKSLTEKGKRPCQTDIQYMKKAQELLHGEISVALGIPFEQVHDYIKHSVKETQAAS